MVIQEEIPAIMTDKHPSPSLTAYERSSDLVCPSRFLMAVDRPDLFECASPPKEGSIRKCLHLPVPQSHVCCAVCWFIRDPKWKQF